MRRIPQAFFEEIANHPTEKERQEARANALQAEYVCRRLPRVKPKEVR